jgi:type III secretion protein J
MGLLGCDARIQHGLDERQANEIQSVLVERGFEAEKVMEGGKKPTWSIDVPQEQAQDSVRILSELGLPRSKADGFGEIFGKGSLVPTPTEERALYLEALSGEIARTLESVEGVAAARVHLVLPSATRPGQLAPASKASAFLRVQPGHADRVNQQRADLRALVAGSVEGLSSDSVTLVVNEVSTQVSAPVRSVPPVQRLRVLVMVLGTALSAVAVVMVILTLRVRRLKAQRVSSKPASQPKPTLNAPAAKRAA